MATLVPPRRSGRPAALPEPWNGLAQHYGGVAATAKKLGVAYQTFRRWALDIHKPSPAHQKALDQLLKNMEKEKHHG